MAITIEEALVARLLADAGVVAAVGTRISPQQAAQGALDDGPCVVYQQVDTVPVMAHDGPSDLVRWRGVFTAFATSYATAKRAIAAIARPGLLVGFRGVVISGSDSLTILGIFPEEANADDLLPPAHSGETGIHASAQSLMVWYRSSSDVPGALQFSSENLLFGGASLAFNP